MKSNFDLERINNLFSDLSSLTYFELLKLEDDYKSIGYSIDEIEIQKHKENYRKIRSSFSSGLKGRLERNDGPSLKTEIIIDIATILSEFKTDFSGKEALKKEFIERIQF